jgi:hypothetical protein
LESLSAGLPEQLPEQIGMETSSSEGVIRELPPLQEAWREVKHGCFFPPAPREAHAKGPDIDRTLTERILTQVFEKIMIQEGPIGRHIEPPPSGAVGLRR